MSARAGDGQVHQIHQRLRSAILRGEYPPGEALSQVRLARELGVTRTPLREALRMLLNEGLIDQELNRGIQIAGYSTSDLEEIYTMRVVLEGLGVRLTVPSLEPETVAELEGALAQMAHFVATRDYPRWEVPHRAFHMGLISGSGQRLVTALAQLSDHAERYRRLYMEKQDPGIWYLGLEEHRAILDSCKSGNVDLASSQQGSHLARTALGVIARMEPDYKPASLMAALVSLDVDPAVLVANR